MSVTDLLNAREKLYGDFGQMARVIQGLKSVYHSSPNWNALTAVQREVLEMDALKTVRILWGDPTHVDNWVDKAGYSTLGAEEFAGKREMLPAPKPANFTEIAEDLNAKTDTV